MSTPSDLILTTDSIEGKGTADLEMTRRRQGPFSLPVPARVTFSYVRTANERLLPLISLHEKYIDNNFSSNVAMWTKQDEERTCRGWHAASIHRMAAAVIILS